MKYDLEDGPLSSGLDSRATETACFDGFLFGFLRKRLSIDCRDFSFSFWFPLVEEAQQIAVVQTPCLSCFRSDNHRWKNQMPTPSVSCTLDFQIKHVRAFLVYSCQHMIFTSMKRWALLGLSKADCWFQRNRQKLTWRTIFHILQSGYWYSVFN